LIFFHAENRLLYNYLTWYEKKIIQIQDQEKKDSGNIHLLTKQSLSIQKKREIAEASFKVLLAYSQKYGINTTQYVDQCIVIDTIIFIGFRFSLCSGYNRDG
jgi:hypothetical protein